MNKVMLYVGLAILLGTVTMIAPLALLGPNDKFPDNKNLTTTEFVVTGPEATEPSDQENFFGEDRTLEAGNFSVQGKTPEPAPVAPLEPTEPAATSDVAPEDAELVMRTTDLTPVGLLTVPSFLVALGVFVYLRKKIS